MMSPRYLKITKKLPKGLLFCVKQTTLYFQHGANSSKDGAGWGRVSVGEKEEQEDLVAKISCVSKDGIAAHGPTHLPVHKYQQGGPTEFVPEMNLS